MWPVFISLLCSLSVLLSTHLPSSISSLSFVLKTKKTMQILGIPISEISNFREPPKIVTFINHTAEIISVLARENRCLIQSKNGPIEAARVGAWLGSIRGRAMGKAWHWFLLLADWAFHTRSG